MAKKEKHYSKHEHNAEYSADLVKGLGCMSQGIPGYNSEPTTEPLVKLSNKFSALHDVSMKEAVRMVGGGYGSRSQEREEA